MTTDKTPLRNCGRQRCRRLFATSNAWLAPEADPPALGLDLEFASVGFQRLFAHVYRLLEKLDYAGTRGDQLIVQRQEEPVR